MQTFKEYLKEVHQKIYPNVPSKDRPKHYKEWKQTENLADWADIYRYIYEDSVNEEELEALGLGKDCDHECTSQCRREGCNCDCGPNHDFEKDIK